MKHFIVTYRIGGTGFTHECTTAAMEKLAVLMGLPQERVVPEVIRRMKQMKGETA